MPIGNESRASCPNAPDMPGSKWSSWLIESETVRWNPIPARLESFDQACTNGPRRVGEARSDMTMIPSTISGAGSSDSSCDVPTSPSVEPSTEASTSVLRPGRPSNTRAISSRAAVSAALPVASGTTAASRAATITICRRSCPARRAITFTSSRPAWVKRCSSGSGNPRPASSSATRAAVRRLPGRPGRRSGSRSAIRADSIAAARPSNRTSAASPCGSGPGRLCNENIVRTSASRAGTKAALYTRGSIMGKAAQRQPTIPKVTASAPRILLVDDELSVQKLLTYPLRKEGYYVVPALDGREALDRLREDNFDLVVLDVMMPKMDGFDVCRQIRARSTVPIIMLTAKTEETDKVHGLELGADDYITKPFSVREFRSRVKAVLRRAALAQPDEQFEEPIKQGDLVIDFERRQVEARGEPVRLTYVEFEVLAALARNPGRVFSRTMLLERVWGDSSYRDPRTIDVHIRHLREKLEEEPKHPEMILTVRGVGYRFRDS